MKFPISVTCGSCGQTIQVVAAGTERFPDAKCSCGQTIYSADNSTVAARMWYRAQSELQDKDFSMCIILSAMAIECELASDFFKWKKIDLGMSNLQADMAPSQAQMEAWEAQYRKWGRISERLDNVFQFLTASDFDSFITARTALSKMLATNHPDSLGCSPKKFFEERLFRKRNGIVHYGRVDFTEAEASACLKLALTLYSIVKDADSFKYDRTFKGTGLPKA